MAFLPTSIAVDMPLRLRHFRPERWVLVALLIALAIWRVWHAPPTLETPSALEPGSYRIARAVDGDTLLLDNGARLRLIGVNTPESVHPERPPEPLGAEAAAFTRQMVEGRSVELTFDRERQDRYGRFLAYVWIDGNLLNETLIRQGYGRATLQYNYSESMKRRFKNAQTQAQAERLGIWALAAEAVPHR